MKGCCPWRTGLRSAGCIERRGYRSRRSCDCWVSRGTRCGRRSHPDAPPKYERRPAGSIVDEVEPRIRELLQAYPRMPATVIAERIGWRRGLTVFKERVAELRPVYLPPDPASRTSYVAGEVSTRKYSASGLLGVITFGNEIAGQVDCWSDGRLICSGTTDAVEAARQARHAGRRRNPARTDAPTRALRTSARRPHTRPRRRVRTATR